MKFREIELFHIRIPFRRSYKHALAEHRSSDTVLAKITTDAGTVGWGETIPRQYLTGETPTGVIETVNNDFWPRISGAEFSSLKDLRPALEELCDIAHDERTTAAYCALELAALDAAGREFGVNAASVLGPFNPRKILYTAPVDNLSIQKAKRRSFVFRLLGFRQYKVKVGGENDIELVGAVRRVVRPKNDIRVDANCAWDAETAIRKGKRLAQYGVSSIEQPTPADDIEAMAEVSRKCGIPIMADESICTTHDARRLIKAGACAIFNVRLAKCGGLLGAKRIVEIARQNGIKWQLGCLVGETGILASAERAFLSRVSGCIHVERPFTRHLLARYVTNRPGPRIPRGSVLTRALKPGGEITILEDSIRRLCVE